MKLREWMESDPGENLGPSQGCLLSLAIMCFFWAAVLIMVWGLWW
jgi:hypothetical protein